jgi:hypothetical protein
MNVSLLDQAQAAIERHAEQAGIALLRGGSFADILRLNQLMIERTIVGEQGQETTLRGQDLVNAKTWERFLSQADVDLSWLSYHVGQIATSYVRWLRSSYTKRYRVIMTNDEIAWLNEVARLAVLWHMLLYKYTTHCMLDPWAESEMGKLLLIREQSRTTARAVNHGRKGEPEQAALLLTQVHEHALTLLENRAFPPYEAIALPPGIPDPLALPERGETS